MKNNSENTIEGTEQEWLRIQQQYWEAWSSLTQQVLETSSENVEQLSRMSSWGDTLEQYWQTIMPALSFDKQDIFKKFIEQGQSYFHTNEQFLKTLQNLSGLDTTSANWQQLWEHSFEELKNNFSNFISKEHLRFLEPPINTWWRTFSSLSLLPGDFLKNFKPEIFQQPTNTLTDTIESLLSVSHPGYLREWQAQMQESIRLLGQYQQSQQEYTLFFNKVGTRAIELLRDKTALLMKKGETIQHLREIYRLWIECAEQAYTECVATDEFNKINANQLNALMAWKQHERKVVDELLGALNIPTRQELDTLYSRLHQMRKEIKALQMEQTDYTMEDLKCEINALRAELEVLKVAAQKPAPTTTAPRKTTAKKTVTKKTTDAPVGDEVENPPKPQKSPKTKPDSGE